MTLTKLLASSLCATAVAMTSVAPAIAETLIRYGHFQPGRLDQPKHAAAMAFEAYVEAASNGRVQVELFPAGQLGNEVTTMEGLQLGTIGMAVIHDGGIAGSFSPIEVFSLPFAFPSQAVAWRVFDGPFKDLMAERMLADTNIHLMGFADNGVRHLTNSERAIVTPADMEGLRIRVQPSQVYVSLIESLGGSPTPVPWGELPAALAQGVVEGQENGVTNIIAASLYENQSHVSLTGHVFSLHAYLVSDIIWQQLSEEDRQVVEDGTTIAIGIHRGMTAAQDSNAGVILADLGLTVTALSPEQRQVFADLAQPAVREYLDGQVGSDLVDALVAAIAEASQ